MDGSGIGRRGLRAARWVAGLAAALAAALAAGPRGARADPEVARFLLAEAKKAIALREHDEAVARLERARTEDPGLVEAAYLLGQVHEKRKDPGQALAAYRAFRDACREQERAGTLDKRAAAWLKKAEARIAALGRGERELEALASAFGDRVLARLRQWKESEPDLALLALEQFLRAEPGHAGAERLRGELTDGGDLALPAAALDPRDVPLRGLERWDDILRRRGIPSGDEVSYQRGALHIEDDGGSLFWTSPRTQGPETFFYETDFRVTKELGAGWLVGLAFARDPDAEARSGASEFVAAFALKRKVVLMRAAGGRHVDVAEAAIDPIVPSTWHRLAVAVKDRKVRVFFEGRQVLNSSIPGRDGLAGEVGLFHQRCVADLRLLRLGTER